MVGTQGDSFVVVFPTARQAVAAALDAMVQVVRPLLVEPAPSTGRPAAED